MYRNRLLYQYRLWGLKGRVRIMSLRRRPPLRRACPRHPAVVGPGFDAMAHTHLDQMPGLGGSPSSAEEGCAESGIPLCHPHSQLHLAVRVERVRLACDAAGADERDCGGPTRVVGRRSRWTRRCRASIGVGLARGWTRCRDDRITTEPMAGRVARVSSGMPGPRMRWIRRRRDRACTLHPLALPLTDVPQPCIHEIAQLQLLAPLPTLPRARRSRDYPLEKSHSCHWSA